MSFMSLSLSGSSRSCGDSRELSNGCRGEVMEYAIAGITSVLLFAYLLYALLKPERF